MQKINIIKHILNWLKLPEFRNTRSIDDVSLSLLRADSIRRKPFLRRLYADFYIEMKESLPHEKGRPLIVELGSGGGFIKEIMPRVITSDILRLLNVNLIFSALRMPFKEEAIDVFLMRDVLHHIGDAGAFLKEVDRCLKIGGKIIMIEPSGTIFNQFLYKKFHYEDFDRRGGWCFKKENNLFSANGALPWIVFCRDRQRFENEFPNLKILKIKIHTSLRCLLSGGVSMREFAPIWAYTIIKSIEMILSPFNRYLGMFMAIELEKTS